jgi:hypothetical protein
LSEAERAGLISKMESRWSRLRQVWWKLAGLALLEVVLVRWLSEPILTHSVLYYPERQPVVLEPSPALQIAVYGAVAMAIVIPFLVWWICRRTPV